MSIHYAACGALFLLGLHGLLYRPNLLRKLMALNVLQVSVVLFYVVLAYKDGAAPPAAGKGPSAAGAFINPLPHALMLTAIVVGAATTGVGLALLIRVHRLFGTLQEGEIRDETGLS
jgi:multicomponent Na+:H+ antiporter subunit C